MIQDAAGPRAGDLYELFGQLDGNGDGRLSGAELRRGLRRLGVMVDDEELDALVEHFDHDGSTSSSGYISRLVGWLDECLVDRLLE